MLATLSPRRVTPGASCTYLTASNYLMKTVCVIILLLTVSSPVAVINPLLPFAILILFYLIYRMTLGRFIKDTRQVNAGFFIAAILLIPTIMVASVMDGGGFASGPFYVEDSGGEIKGLTPSSSVAYGPGQLVAYAGNEKRAAVLAYAEDGEVRWASELKTGDDPALTVETVVEMDVRPGLLRDRVDFFASGTSEPGWAYVYKWGGVQKFYLKIF